MTDKEKIIQYLDSKGLNRHKFYEITKLSNGYLDKGSTLSLDKLRVIIEKFPELGDILLPEMRNVDNNPCNETKVEKNIVSEAQSIYGVPKNQLEEKERAIIYLEKSLLDKEELIHLHKEQNQRLQNEINAMKSEVPLTNKAP